MNILLMYGGKSCEHDISLITACLAKGYFKGNLYCAYLDENNRCFSADVSLTPAAHKKRKFKKEITFALGQSAIFIGRRKVHVDVAVNCCHGVNGEDGSVAGLLNLANIAQAESGVVSSAAAMDKVLTKYLLKGAGFPVLDGVFVTAEEVKRGTACKKITETLRFPVIVKPATLGSSIGIGVAADEKQLQRALEIGAHFDRRLLAEQALTHFYEINCSAMEKEGEVLVSRTERPVTANEILTFEDKYVNGGKGTGGEVGADERAETQRMTAEIYRLFGFSGVIRIDFIFDKDADALYVNEINTVPGSLAYNLWKDKFTRTEFGNVLLSEAWTRQRADNALTHRFVSSVFEGKGGKK